MFSLKRLILEQLQISLKELELALGAVGATDPLILRGGLKQVEDTAEVKYSSAIACQQARLLGQPIPEIASQIQALLQESNASELEKISGDESAWIWQEIEIFLVNETWLYFRVKPQGVIAWFHRQTQQQVNKFPMEIPEGRFLSGGPVSWADALSVQDLFGLQYSHGRCCSLLRLAADLGLDWPVDPLETALWDAQAVWQHPAERALLWHLVHVSDRLSLAEWKRARDLSQAAIALSEAFLTFYGAVRIVEAVRHDQRAIAQARVGLVWLTQQTLRYLLEIPFASVAPDSL